ncbi:zinc ribbon domain-containing protein [Ralstonia pickettii]|nr:zinc ribbon domain-containing protein [Ralstonia pickettii]
MSLLKRLFGGHHGGHRPNGGHHGRRHGDAHDRAQAGIPSNPWPTTCLGCGSIASQRARFCPQCEKSLTGVVCGQCGSTAQPARNFVPNAAPRCSADLVVHCAALSDKQAFWSRS